MAIQRVEIKDFTVFENFTLEASGGVNVIIGENATGKTHLLKLLYGFGLANSPNDLKHNLPALDRLFHNEILPLPLTYHYSYNPNYTTRFSIKGCKVDSEKCPEAILTHKGVDHPSLLSTFIPAKEVLSMSNITKIYDKYGKALDFDPTIIEIIKQAQWLAPDEIPHRAKIALEKISKAIDGEVFVKDDDTFWVKKTDGKEIPFTLEAEGYRKLGLLWQLLRNDSIQSILLWDEPEANINPNLIPVLAEIILELSRNGTQVFIATHDYFFAKYIEVLSQKGDMIAFHSLLKTTEGVKCETSDKFSTLDNNAIIDEKIRLYEAEIEKVME